MFTILVPGAVAVPVEPDVEVAGSGRGDLHLSRLPLIELALELNPVFIIDADGIITVGLVAGLAITLGVNGGAEKIAGFVGVTCAVVAEQCGETMLHRIPHIHFTLAGGEHHTAPEDRVADVFRGRNGHLDLGDLTGHGLEDDGFDQHFVTEIGIVIVLFNHAGAGLGAQAGDAAGTLLVGDHTSDLDVARSEGGRYGLDFTPGIGPVAGFPPQPLMDELADGEGGLGISAKEVGDHCAGAAVAGVGIPLHVDLDERGGLEHLFIVIAVPFGDDRRHIKMVLFQRGDDKSLLRGGVLRRNLGDNLDQHAVHCFGIGDVNDLRTGRDRFVPQTESDNLKLLPFRADKARASLLGLSGQGPDQKQARSRPDDDLFPSVHLVPLPGSKSGAPRQFPCHKTASLLSLFFDSAMNCIISILLKYNSLWIEFAAPRSLFYNNQARVENSGFLYPG